MKVLKENEIAVDRTVMKEICNTVRELSGYADSIKPSEISKIIKDHMELDNSDKEKIDTLCSDLENTKIKLEEILSKLMLDENYVHTDNNFTDKDKNKLSGLHNTELPDDLVCDKDYVHTDNNFTNDDKEKLNNFHNTELPEHLVADENYVHTDNNFTDKDKEKLDSIECVIQDDGYVHTDNNFTDDDKKKLDELHNTELPEYLVTDENYIHTDNNFTDEDKEKIDSFDFKFNALEGKVNDTSKYNEVKDGLDFVKEEINKILSEDKHKDDIEKIYSKLEELETKIDNFSSIDKSIVHSGYYNSANRTIVIVLSNGDKVEVPAGSLVDIYDGDNKTITMNKRTNTFSVSESLLNKIEELEGK